MGTTKSREKQIVVNKNRSLRLDNVLIKEILHLNGEDNGMQNFETGEDSISLDFEVDKMQNLIKCGGANQVGPLIQYSGKTDDETGIDIRLILMLQADRYINNISPPYCMKPVIKVKNCMYTRFMGWEEDIKYAYQKIMVTAYEEDIKLKGSSYTIFLDSDDDGTIVADIFMERADA